MIRILQALGFGTLSGALSASTSATVNSASIDTLGKGDTMFVVSPVTTTGAPTAVLVQDSPDDSTWTDLAGAELATADLPTSTDDGLLFGIIVTADKTPHNRYLRTSWTQGGVGASTVMVLPIHENTGEFPINAGEAGFSALTFA